MKDIVKIVLHKPICALLTWLYDVEGKKMKTPVDNKNYYIYKFTYLKKTVKNGKRERNTE